MKNEKTRKPIHGCFASERLFSVLIKFLFVKVAFSLPLSRQMFNCERSADERNRLVVELLEEEHFVLMVVAGAALGIGIARDDRHSASARERA